MTWHADRTLLAGYRDGTLSGVACSSVEAHLLACSECRDEVSRIVPSGELDATWDEIVTTISLPQTGWLERVLSRFGVAEPLARLVGVTPSLQRPWLAGVMITVLLAMLVSHLASGGSAALFMIVAPLLPVAGVAVAFGPGVDPTYELLVAAPVRNFDVLVARAVAVLATTVPITAVASAALPVAGWDAVAWLLPALALTALTVAVGSWVVPWKAAAVLGGLWVGPAAVYTVGVRPDPAVLDAVGGAAGQLTMLAVLVASALLVMVRRTTFDLEVV
jgi:hypothetical protein